jgi:hypothetical protein
MRVWDDRHDDNARQTKITSCHCFAPMSLPLTHKHCDHDSLHNHHSHCYSTRCASPSSSTIPPCTTPLCVSQQQFYHCNYELYFKFIWVPSFWCQGCLMSPAEPEEDGAEKGLERVVALRQACYVPSLPPPGPTSTTCYLACKVFILLPMGLYRRTCSTYRAILSE